MKLTQKHKLAAYILNKDFGYNMAKIGVLMEVTQSTISRAIKDIEHEKNIHNLVQELESAKKFILDQGYEEPKIIPALTPNSYAKKDK